MGKYFLKSQPFATLINLQHVGHVVDVELVEHVESSDLVGQVSNASKVNRSYDKHNCSTINIFSNWNSRSTFILMYFFISFKKNIVSIMGISWMTIERSSLNDVTHFMIGYPLLYFYHLYLMTSLLLWDMNYLPLPSSNCDVIHGLPWWL